MVLAGQKVKVTFVFEMPVEADDTDLREWLWFELAGHSMYLSNKLDGHEIQAISLTYERV